MRTVPHLRGGLFLGILTIGGLPVARVGAVLIEAGAVTAGTDAVLMANGKKNQDAGYNRGKKNKATFTQGEGDKAKDNNSDTGWICKN